LIQGKAINLERRGLQAKEPSIPVLLAGGGMVCMIQSLKRSLFSWVISRQGSININPAESKKAQLTAGTKEYRKSPAPASGVVAAFPLNPCP